MANERSEQDMAAMSPIKIAWGAKQYDLKPLPREKARAWRDKFSGLVRFASDSTTFPVPEDGDLQKWASTQVMSGVLMTLARSPEKLEELVFAFCPELPQDDSDATDEQVLVAFKTCFALAFPFFTVLGMLMDTAKMSTSSAAPKYTN